MIPSVVVKMSEQIKNCQTERIRTSDPVLPRDSLYLAELQSVTYVPSEGFEPTTDHVLSVMPLPLG